MNNPPAHSHHWRIAEPAGPTSQANCLTCPATREFQNFDATSFQDKAGKLHFTPITTQAEHQLGV